ncbi:MAG: AmmeMemoRadiSam system radical SAM enzyme [Candidatus Doudnabacteria bacterium]
MREAILYKKLKYRKARCNVCSRRCVISEGCRGYCETRLNQGGKLYTLIYGLASSVCVDPIEKKPVFHYQPGTKALSLGTWGCNFRCVFCQNYDITYINGNRLEETAQRVSEQKNSSEDIPKKGILEPNLISKIARKEGCQGIAWTYNEPTIWLEYTLDASKLAKKEGLYTVYVTNGYATPEALDTIGPYLDVWRVDIKSMEDKFYQEIAKVPRVSLILENTIRAQKKWKMHIEVVTNIIPTLNDSDTNLGKTAKWICKNLGEKTPWHITRFFPCLGLKHLPMTPIETLERAQEIGQKAGLKFVYLGNIDGHPGENTICPRCGNLAIRRVNYEVDLEGLGQQGECKKCGEDLNIFLK